MELAYDQGYFDIPRQINQIVLILQHGISDSAFSQRLRRGITIVLNENVNNSGLPRQDRMMA